MPMVSMPMASMPMPPIPTAPRAMAFAPKPQQPLFHATLPRPTRSAAELLSILRGGEHRPPTAPGAPMRPATALAITNSAATAFTAPPRRPSILQKPTSAEPLTANPDLQDRLDRIWHRGRHLGFGASPYFPKTQQDLLDVLLAGPNGAATRAQACRNLADEIAERVDAIKKRIAMTAKPDGHGDPPHVADGTAREVFLE